MAIGKKTGGRDLVPGQSGNPNGRPRIPDDLKKARQMNRIQFEELLSKYIKMSGGELNLIIRDPNTSAIDMIVCQIIVKAVAQGDYKRLDFLLNRLIGKVKDVIEHHVGHNESIVDAIENEQ